MGAAAVGMLAEQAEGGTVYADRASRIDGGDDPALGVDEARPGDVEIAFFDADSGAVAVHDPRTSEDETVHPRRAAAKDEASLALADSAVEGRGAAPLTDIGDAPRLRNRA